MCCGYKSTPLTPLNKKFKKLFPCLFKSGICDIHIYKDNVLIHTTYLYNPCNNIKVVNFIKMNCDNTLVLECINEKYFEVPQLTFGDVINHVDFKCITKCEL